MEAHLTSINQHTALAPEGLIKLLSGYLQDVIAGKPFNVVLHPNGYIKCVLETKADGSRPRLHMWDSAIGGYRGGETRGLQERSEVPLRLVEISTHEAGSVYTRRHEPPLILIRTLERLIAGISSS